MVAMKGATIKDAPAADNASAPTRRGRLVVFHLVTGEYAADNWSAVAGLGRAGGVVHGVAEHGA
jgi:hypothetical protein